MVKHLLVRVLAIRLTITTSFQGPTPPIGGDMAKHAMLDSVPLTGSGRVVTDRDVESGLLASTVDTSRVAPQSGFREGLGGGRVQPRDRGGLGHFHPDREASCRPHFSAFP